MPRPGAVLGRLLRAPVVLYELGAGPLLGHRFLLLVHRGWRMTGARPHGAVSSRPSRWWRSGSRPLGLTRNYGD